VESKQLKSALKGRDLRLVDVEARLEALQGKQHDELKHQRHQLMALTAERDDLLVSDVGVTQTPLSLCACAGTLLG
jgi:hypothetical protein